MITFTHKLPNNFVKRHFMYWAYFCLFNLSQYWFYSHIIIFFFFKINNETKAGTEGNMKHFFKPMPDQHRKFVQRPQYRTNTGIPFFPKFPPEFPFHRNSGHSLAIMAHLSMHLLGTTLISFDMDSLVTLQRSMLGSASN